MDPEQQAAAEAAAKEAADKAAADKAKAEQEAADKAAADKAAADKAAADAAASTDAEAGNEKLTAAQAEIARLQAIADKFAGLDPEAARAAIAANEAAEAARVQAEKDKAKAEGDFEKLRELQQAETDAALAAANTAREAAEKERDEARAEMQRSKIESAFANSKYLQDETILSGPNAQRLFGDYVEVEGMNVTIYDKPAGAEKRAKVMDSKGNALPFDVAIKQILESDANKDAFLKTKTTPGAASSTTEGKTAEAPMSNHARIAAGLKALREK